MDAPIIIAAAAYTFALVASISPKSAGQPVHTIRVPVVGWRVVNDGDDAVPVIPLISSPVAVAVELPEGQLLCNGRVLDDPGDLIDYVEQLRARQPAA